MELVLRLADWTLKSTVVFLAAGAVAWILANRSAALRHLVWGLALAAALTLPALSVIAPSWPAPVRLALLGPGRIEMREPKPVGAAPVVNSREAPAPHPAGTAGAADRVLPAAQFLTPVDLAPTNESSPAPSAAARLRGVASAFLASWPAFLLPIWTAGALAVLATIGLGLARTRRVKHAGRMARMAVRAIVPELSARLALRRPVTLLEVEGPCMPMTFGDLHPVVVLPVDAASWPEDRVRAVLLHELAHIKRHDYLTQLIARLACALYWFNPLVWVAARRLRVERELACDDLVLAAGPRASDYATHLLEIARGLRVSALAGVASVAMARRSQLAGRLLAVLDARRARRAVGARAAGVGSALALALVLPLAGAETWDPRGEPVAAGETAVPIVTRPAERAPALPAGATPDITLPASSEWQPAPTVAEEPVGARLRQVAADFIASRSPVLAWAAGRATQADCVWDARDRGTSASFNVSDDRLRVRLSMGRCAVDVDAEGTITFTDDDDDVAAISSGGYFEIAERAGTMERRLEVKPRNGGLDRRWVVDGTVQPYDAEARAWLGRTLLIVFRRAGLDAEHRAQRILQRGGVDGVLREVDQIASDYVARKYFQVLLASQNLDPATLQRVVRQAGQQIHSDFELTELLIAIAKQQANDEPVRLAYVEAVGTISSDYERHRALKAVLTRQEISRELAAAMLKAAQGITSDFELAGLLIEVAQAHPVDANLAPAFFEAAATIQSDYERHRVLKNVVAGARGDQALLERALDIGAGIKSDYERASFLTEVAAQYPPDRPLPPAFLTAATTMRSGFEQRRSLTAVLIRDRLGPAAVVSALEAAASITGDFDLAELLVTVARRYAMDDVVRPAFFRAANTIQSDFDHGRVLKAVVAQKPLAEPTVLAVLESSVGIHSDFEQAELLIQLAKAYPVDDKVRPAFLKAAERIQSEYERGRVLAAVFPRSVPAQL